MEEEETNLTTILLYLKQIKLQLSDLKDIKKDIESLKRDQKRSVRLGQQICDGPISEEQEQSSKREPIQRNQRSYSFQGRDDLKFYLRETNTDREEIPLTLFNDFISLENSLSHYELKWYNWKILGL